MSIFERPEALAIASIVAVAVGAILVASSRGAPIERFSAGNNFDVALAVTKAYKTVLERTPTEAELIEFHDRLTSDSEFDVAALEATLRETGEFRRLTRLQSQSANPGLEGTLTEAQVLAKLRRLYRQKVGVDPDDATLMFLRERYRRTRLDDDYIRSLIENIAAAGKAPPGEKRDPDLKRFGDISRRKGGSSAASDRVEFGSVGSGADTADDAEAERSIDGRDRDALSKLCKKLGVDADKAAIGNMSGDALLGGRCPRDGDLPPDNLAQRVEQRNIEGASSVACRASRAAAAAGLYNAGYTVPGEKAGVWSLPQRRPPICLGGGQLKGRSVWGPVNSQTALIGTPIEASQEMEDTMKDLVLM